MVWIDVLIFTVFIGAFLLALMDMYKKRAEGQGKSMHYRSIKSPVPSNLELFNLFHPVKKQEEKEDEKTTP